MGIFVPIWFLVWDNFPQLSREKISGGFPMKTVWDRIDFLRNGKPLAAFCREAGLNYQRIKKSSQRGTPPDAESLANIARHYRVDPLWLIAGNPPALKTNQQIARKIRSLRKRLDWTPEQLAQKLSVEIHVLEAYEKGAWSFPLDLLTDVAKALSVPPQELLARDVAAPAQTPELKIFQANSTGHSPKIRDEDYISIPLTDSSIAAGQPIIQENKIEDYVLLHIRAAGKKNNLVASRVDGESMEPMLHSGDIVVIDRDDKKIQKNTMFAIFYEDGLTAKYVERKNDILILRPINPNSEVQILNLRENPDPIVGRIIGAWKEL